MLYYLFDYLNTLNFPGAGLFQYISFRAGLALIFSLIVSIVIGKKIIHKLRQQQIGETVRDLGLAGQIPCPCFIICQIAECLRDHHDFGHDLARIDRFSG
jgi:hypothetical protein